MTEVLLPVPRTTVGQTFHVKASVSIKAESFSVELVDSSTTEIYFRFKANFKDKIVERNAALENDAGWGKAETSEEFPFKAPMSFDLVIKVETSHFNVLLNGNSFCIFRHRAPFHHINSVRVSGDIEVDFVEVSGVTEAAALGSVGSLVHRGSLQTPMARYPKETPVEAPEKEAPVSSKDQPTGPGPPPAAGTSPPPAGTPSPLAGTPSPPVGTPPKAKSPVSSPASSATKLEVKSDARRESKTKLQKVAAEDVNAAPGTPAVSRMTSRTFLPTATPAQGAGPAVVRAAASKTKLPAEVRQDGGEAETTAGTKKKGCCEVM